MKLSLGLQMMLEPVTNLIGLPQHLADAIKKEGKRGTSCHYPTDAKRLKVELTCKHDVTGREMVVPVYHGDFRQARSILSNLVRFEDQVAKIFA